MKFKVTLAVLMVLLLAGLLILNRPRPVVIEPAPTVQTARPKLPAHFTRTVQNPATESTPTNIFRHILMDGGDFPKLTAEQVAAYLLANHRNSESLLAAMYTTGDRAFMREAMTNFPNDPKVNYAALYFGNLTPEETRQWMDNYKRVDPGNPMANYVSALNYFKSGQGDLALQDMANAAGKSRWTDYSAEFMQNSQEAYRSAGFSELDATAAAQSGLLLPDLAQLKQLGVKLGDLAKTYQQAGDSTSAQAALQMDVQLGQRLSATDAQPLITSLVGYAVERIALDGMDPSAPYGENGGTVQDQIDALKAQRAYIKQVVNQAEPLKAIMSDEDFITFFQRRRSFGEISAVNWALNKYGQH